MPTCSLVIPVYNHASYLAECIESAINQDQPFDEIVIIDDCSPDPMVKKILSQFIGRDHVRIIWNKENLGITATQNLAVGLCVSEFIAFLDCDDYLHSEARAGFEAYYNIYPADYFFSNRIEFDDQGMQRKINVSEHIFAYETLTQCLLEHMVATHFKVIRKSSLNAVGGFPTSSDGVQDWVVAVNIIRDDNAVHIPEYLYYHRIHPGQTTSQDSVRYVNIVNAERELQLDKMGFKSARQRERVRSLVHYFQRVERLPLGSFLLRDGLLEPWVASTMRTEILDQSLLFYSPRRHSRIAQDFYLCKSRGAETVMIVDHRYPDSIAVTRWANAFFDHIVCLSAVARLAVEPWVADKAKLIQNNECV